MRRWEVAIRRMPLPAKAAAKQVMRVADPAVVAAYRLRTGEQHPIPPFRLRARVGVPGHDIAGFLATGRRVAGVIEKAVEHIGRPLDSFERVLDFGCGNGRVISHLALSSDKPEFHGSDVDHEAIAWGSRHFPHVRFGVNPALPPTAFPDAHFDLVYSISIFTHLNERSQDLWLSELERILRPGGVALLTTNGEHALDWHRRDARAVESTHDMSRRLVARGDLDAEGFVFEPYRRPRWDGTDFRDVEETYGLTFHSEAYVRQRWGRLLDVEDHLPGLINSGQDLVIATKPAADDLEPAAGRAA